MSTNQASARGTNLRRLRALVLLGGSVRQGQLVSQVGRSVFELPIEKGRSILDLWHLEAQRLAALLGRASLPIRVLVDQDAPKPLPVPAEVQVERDPQNYRGSGGVARDIAVEYADDDVLLVANAAQVLMEPLVDLVQRLAAMGGDASIISHRNGIPSGLMLFRCGVLRELPEAGFVDLKEQALPTIAAHHQVTVLEVDGPSGMPVRTPADYTRALRRYYRRGIESQDGSNAFAEDWESAFAIVEDGAEIHPTARLHDSVVLQGGRVEAGAVLAHSIVCPGAVIEHNQVIVNGLIASMGDSTQRG
ncbi:MAG: hypothetical protein ACM359_24330 [Bacillota bacterium]